MAVKKVKQPTMQEIMGMVEDIFDRSDSPILTVAKIHKAMPAKVDRSRLVIALNRLIRANKIYNSAKGMTWIENRSMVIKSIVRAGRRL